MEKGIYTRSQRDALIRSYAEKTVFVEIDRPVGFVHRKGGHEIVYPINYGFLPGVMGGDGEELDVYILDSAEPLKSATVRIVGAVWRSDDVEDKLLATIGDAPVTGESAARAIHFQEKYHDSRVEIFIKK